jgi:hypothetical protein
MPEELLHSSRGAFLLYIIAVGLVGFGFFTMFAYGGRDLYGDPGLGMVVGGDAYNYIIIGVRGAGFIVAGGVSALLGLAATVAHEHRRTRWTLEHASRQ